jgi:lipopolysaccharide/colanic/teichoic acid biosynthesis glycosyltransferase
VNTQPVALQRRARAGASAARVARVAKRALDVTVSVVVLLILGWAMLLIALAIRVDSGGPVFFRQVRVGRGERRFHLVKFRTMVPGAEAMAEALRDHSQDPHWLLLSNDPRVTRVGRILRRTSLDELPGLWNVLRGHMSLVGPRPLSEGDCACVPGWGQARFDVPAGVTGLWQVEGRTRIGFEDMIRLDCRYVRTWSLWSDLVLLARTVPAVLTARGAN